MPSRSATPNWQTPMPSHPGTSNWHTPIPSHPHDAGLFNPEEVRPIMYRRTPYMDLPPTTVLPKKRGDKTKNKGKNANISPLNLGNAFADDNVGEDDIMIMDERETGPSTPPSYSSGPLTPPNYSLGSSRNAECSNCKHLRGKISVLKATMEMHMHPEQHTVNSAALFHEVLNEMEKLDLE
ncbi:hypothetical protein Tco_0548032 [Tanacetum coccineum]